MKPSFALLVILTAVGCGSRPADQAGGGAPPTAQSAANKPGEVYQALGAGWEEVAAALRPIHDDATFDMHAARLEKAAIAAGQLRDRHDALQLTEVELGLLKEQYPQTEKYFQEVIQAQSRVFSRVSGTMGFLPPDVPVGLEDRKQRLNQILAKANIGGLVGAVFGKPASK